MTIREIIIEYRTKNNLSQRQFAERCGVSNGYISMLENDINPSTGKPAIPSLKMLRKIAKGMNMTIDELLAANETLLVGLSDEKKAASEKAAKKQEFIELYDRLTPEEKKLIIAQMQGILAAR